MKKVFLIAAAGLMISLSSNAQVDRKVNPSQKIQSDSSHHSRKGKMMSDLNLTTEQKAQLKEMRERNKQQRDAIKNDASLTQDQKKEKMKELHTSQKDGMKTILTPEQQTKMQQHMKNMKHKNKMKKGKGEKHQKKNKVSPVQQG